MATICNIDSDLLRNVTGVCIVPARQNSCYMEDILKETSVLDILNAIKKNEKDTNILDIDVLPEDVTLNSKQKESSAGMYTTHSYSITVQPNQLDVLKKIHNFLNTKVLLFLKVAGEVSETYLIGTNEQGLNFLLEEYTTYFVINLSGDTFFTALRN